MFKLWKDRYLLSDKERAQYQDSYRKWGDTLYWFNLFVAMIFVLYVLAGKVANGEYKQEYATGNTAISRPGFLAHALAGCCFYITGYLQFSDSIRRNYPTFHRVCGMIYLGMSALLFFAIIVVICAGAIAPVSSAFWISFMLPYWVYLHADALRSIWRRDIERHRRMMLRGFIVANMIVYQRIPTFVIASMGDNISEALSIAFWWVTVLAICAGEIYLYLDAYLSPPSIVYLEDGSKFYASQENQPALDCDPVPITIDECTLSADQTSVQLVFRQAGGSSNTNYGAMSFFFPGQYVSLQHAEVSGSAREYSPIVNEADAKTGRVRLWIRLIPGGVMSNVLRDLAAKKVSSTSVNAEDGDVGTHKVEMTSIVKNPIRGSDAAVSANESSKLLFSVCSARFPYFANNYQALLMLCTGTGLIPLSTLVSYVMKNRADRTKVHLVYITNKAAVGDAATSDDYGLRLLAELENFNSIIGGDRLVVEKLSSRPRLGIDSVERIVQKGRDDGTFGPGPLGVQLHLSGNPAFVKGLFLSARNSKVLGFAAEQVVGWGYSDR